MREGVLRSDAPRVVVSQRREAPGCCASDWISAASVSTGSRWKRVGSSRPTERVAPDRDALARLGRRLGDALVLAVIESMSGARFVHDQLELADWVKGVKIRFGAESEF
jgi:hypothetical protein